MKKGTSLFENYRQYYEANWQDHWSKYKSEENPLVERIIWNKKVQKDYGLCMGYFCALSLDLFDRDIDFDKVFKVNNLWLAIKLLDDVVDEGHSDYPGEFLNAVHDSLWSRQVFESGLEANASHIFKDAMESLDYMNNPNLCEATYNLKESVKRSLWAQGFKEFLDAGIDAGKYSGESTGYGLIPNTEHDSDFMEYMRRISIAVKMLDDIKNYKDDKENFRLNGNGSNYILSASSIFSNNLHASIMKLPKGKKLKFLISTIPHSSNVFR